jgi:hypothetical protein
MKKLFLIAAGIALGVLALACFFGGPPDLLVTPLGVLFVFGSFSAFKAARKAPQAPRVPAEPRPWGEGWERR